MGVEKRAQGLGDAGAGDGAAGVVEVLVFLAEDPGQDLAERGKLVTPPGIVSNNAYFFKKSVPI